jgi:hypothetical protein
MLKTRVLTMSLTRSTSLCCDGLVTAAMYLMMILLASVLPAPLSPGEGKGEKNKGQREERKCTTQVKA